MPKHYVKERDHATAHCERCEFTAAGPRARVMALARLHFRQTHPTEAMEAELVDGRRYFTQCGKKAVMRKN